MSRFKLSIICPVYNCAPYLEDTISSLVNGANREEVEVIFVDDCSTDGSADLCRQQLQSRAESIKFTWHVLSHQVNAGLSASRNTGIAQATGRYIAFLDGDDAIGRFYAEAVLTAIDACSPDVLEFTHREFKTLEEATFLDEPPASTGIQVLQGPRRYKTLYRHGFFVWTRVYRREVIGQGAFVEDGRAYEDIAFTMDVFARVDRIHRLNATLIGYRRRAGSITASRNLRFLDQLIQLNESIQRNREKFNAGMALEMSHLRKLIIVLLKGIRISPRQDRVVFYRSAIKELRPQRPMVSCISIMPSKLFSSFLLGVAKLQTFQPG